MPCRSGLATSFLVLGRASVPSEPGTETKTNPRRFKATQRDMFMFEVPSFQLLVSKQPKHPDVPICSKVFGLHVFVKFAASPSLTVFGHVCTPDPVDPNTAAFLTKQRGASLGRLRPKTFLYPDDSIICGPATWFK